MESSVNIMCKGLNLYYVFLFRFKLMYFYDRINCIKPVRLKKKFTKN